MDLKSLLKKAEDIKKSGNYDLSLEEDMSIAVMNLVSLEEHFFMTSQKTGKDEYLALMQEARDLRKKYLARMIDVHEGETWCVTKHLLAATMRLIEVGTKYQTSGKTKEAKTAFADAYRLYNLFWTLRLKLIKLPNIPMTTDDLVAKLVDCCKE